MPSDTKLCLGSVELEEGGVVKMIWDFYFDSGPLHTYRANMDDVSDTKLYLGSVKTKGIPRPVEVDVISANSPCQGFSAGNVNVP